MDFLITMAIMVGVHLIIVDMAGGVLIIAITRIMEDTVTIPILLGGIMEAIIHLIIMDMEAMELIMVTHLIIQRPIIPTLIKESNAITTVHVNRTMEAPVLIIV